MKKIVQRTCMGCNSKKNKNELIRLVLNKSGEMFVDETGKAEGRGAYICNDIECLEKSIKTKRLERVFKTKINNQLYENIRGVIIERKSKKENIQ